MKTTETFEYVFKSCFLETNARAKPLLAIAGIVLVSHVPNAFAQAFDSGSDGSMGDLAVTENTTLDMPDNGVFHYKTITIAANATLKFNKNQLNTPVVLLAQGDVTINGFVDISGQAPTGVVPGEGGPGGFRGGYGSSQGKPTGEGQGPGGGKVGEHAAFSVAVASNGRVYGNRLNYPLIGGSGGGGNGDAGGAGGGGVILIASSTTINVNLGGSVTANGGAPSSLGGSGGAIRLVAPKVGGAGKLEADQRTASPGRIRIDCTDRNSFRTLSIGGSFLVGRQMFALPPNPPLLSLVEIAGQTIPLDATVPFSITIPAGSPTTQTIKIAARNFTKDVPISVAVIPENGTAIRVDGVILQSSGTPPTASVEVDFPIDVLCSIQTWSR